MCDNMKVKVMRKFVFGLIGALTAFIPPLFASAHEMYVLSSASVAQATDMPSFNMLDVAVQNSHEFLFWAFIIVLAVFCVFFISALRFIERRLDPIFIRIRKYAPVIARFTIGISFLACAYYQATFGPELPLSSTFGSFSGILAPILAILGGLVIIGLWVRPAACIALFIYCCAVWSHGIYMLTYVNYLGEIIVLLILGAHGLSLDAYFAAKRRGTGSAESATGTWFSKIKDYLMPRSFAILRVLFGVALVYASAYAKIIHNNLALFTVEQYHLDKILGFEPHFLVLGAAIIELMIGLFFIVGFEIRFTSLFFLFWLILSLVFFGEVVWPHLMLIGIPIAYLFYGYDRYSLEGYLFRNRKYEPVL